MTTKLLLERKRPKRYWNEIDTMAAILLVFVLVVVMTCFASCTPAHAEPDYQALSVAIRQAEGNPNYGILTHYKHTSYEQACKNTCRHAYKDWVKTLPRAEKGPKTGRREAYLKFLANRYAPRHVLNDPHDLNKNWLTNVSTLYKGDV